MLRVFCSVRLTTLCRNTENRGNSNDNDEDGNTYAIGIRYDRRFMIEQLYSVAMVTAVTWTQIPMR